MLKIKILCCTIFCSKGFFKSGRKKYDDAIATRSTRICSIIFYDAESTTAF